MKKILIVWFLLLSNYLLAADPILGGNTAMQQTGTEIKSWFWIVSLAILGLGLGAVVLVYTKMMNKEEVDTQHKTSGIKMGFTLLGTFIVTEIALFIIIGTVGKAFLDLSFGDTWKMLVINPLRALLGLQ